MSKFLWVVLLFAVIPINAQLFEDHQAYQIFPGVGVLGQVTSSQYRDGNHIPWHFHLDASFFNFPIWLPSTFGIEYDYIPFHPYAPYAIDTAQYQIDWLGHKQLILGKIGWNIYRDNWVEMNFAANIGWGQIYTSWAATSAGTNPSYNHISTNASISGFSLGGSLEGRVNIPCTHINFWGKISYYYTTGLGAISNVTDSPPGDESKDLFTLMAGLEVNLIKTCVHSHVDLQNPVYSEIPPAAATDKKTPDTDKSAEQSNLHKILHQRRYGNNENIAQF